MKKLTDLSGAEVVHLIDLGHVLRPGHGLDIRKAGVLGLTVRRHSQIPYANQMVAR